MRLVWCIWLSCLECVCFAWAGWLFWCSLSKLKPDSEIYIIALACFGSTSSCRGNQLELAVVSTGARWGASPLVGSINVLDGNHCQLSLAALPPPKRFSLSV